jgi:DNA-binding MarR family transcriptional regulator
VAKAAQLNPASVTAMIDQLEARQLVKRPRDTQGRRQCWISLTESGRLTKSPVDPEMGATMHFETTAEIDARQDTVWSTLADVDRWPEWNESIQEVTWLGDTKLAEGGRVRLKQPGLPAVVWLVSDVRPGTGFSWRSTSPGLTTFATHSITPTSDDHILLALGIHQSGLLAPVLGLLFGRRTRRYVQMEADGLKRRSETTSGGSSYE